MPLIPMEYGLLKVSGEQGKAFLQGQLTCDMEQINESPHLAAHCHPQGRVISLFQIFKHENDYFLLMPLSLIPICLSALIKYAIFYKISITDSSADISRYQSILPDLSHLHAKQFNAGIPTLYPETSNRFLPHELNLPQLNAISFEKGCYTGQEIIARMHYRGKLKNHLYKATVETTTTPQLGSEIFINPDKIVGNIIDYYPIPQANHYQLLIVCAEESANQQLFIQNPTQTYIMVEVS